ncbi:uncharacterized protein AAEQ78_012028 [Lycaon pictus]
MGPRQAEPKGRAPRRPRDRGDAGPAWSPRPRWEGVTPPPAPLAPGSGPPAAPAAALAWARGFSRAAAGGAGREAGGGRRGRGLFKAAPGSAGTAAPRPGPNTLPLKIKDWDGAKGASAGPERA